MRTEASTTSSDFCYVLATSSLTIEMFWFWIPTPTLLFCLTFSFGASSHHMTSIVGINIYSCVINIQHTLETAISCLSCEGLLFQNQRDFVTNQSEIAHIWKRPEVRFASSHFVKCSSGSAGDAFIWQKWSVYYEMYFSILIQQSAQSMSASLKSCQHRFWTCDGDRVGLGNPWGPCKWEDACIFMWASSDNISMGGGRICWWFEWYFGYFQPWESMYNNL